MVSELLLAALIGVESGGDTKAKGDGGKAIGCLQIHKGVVEDVNRIYRLEKGFVWPDDCYDKKKAVQICYLYLCHYSCPKRLGREPTPEDMARIWNGGPNGYRKKNTLKYWVKVKAAMVALHTMQKERRCKK